MRGRGSFLATATVGLLLLAPPAAQAADAFVDFETGVDGPTCGAMGAPCKTIPTGIDNAGVSETVRVDDSATGYISGTSGLNLGFGKSLVAEDFVGGDENALPEPDTIIDMGEIAIGTPAIRVPSGGGGGTIRDFVIRSIYFPVHLGSSTTLTGNLIDEDGGMLSCLVEVANAGNASTVTNNVIVDPSPTATPKTGVCAFTSGSPSITSNTFQDLNHGVQVIGGNTAVTSNTFTGIRGATSNAAVEVTSGTPTITGNLIQLPGDAFVLGIALQQTGNSIDVGAALRRNTILGYRVGVVANETEFPVSLNGDLIAKSGQVGLATNDAVDNDDDGAVTAANVTIADNVISEIALNGTQLTLNSGLLAGTFGISTNADAECAINFSRGPSIGPGCSDFQTTAAPGFVNPAANDYHLTAGSAMIDMGEPGPALPGILDLDGQERVTDGNGDGVARRDIGADEMPADTAPPMVTPPAPTSSSSTPASTPGTTSKTKCKKKRKGRGAATAKKKCRRKGGRR